MFDARDLLGKIMQTGMAKSSSDRIAHGLGPEGVGRSGNPIGDLLGGILGKGGAGGGLGGMLGQGGGLGGLASQAETMLRGPGGKDALAMGGLASLAGVVLGGRHGGMGGAVGGGLLAFLGTLAYSALKNRAAAGAGAGAPAAPAGAGAGAPAAPAGAAADTAELVREAPLGLREPQTPAEEDELQNTALLAIRAMINAAKADGAIDGGEMSRIMGKLGEFGIDGEARDFVMNELQKPLDTDGLVRAVSSPEVAVQVYSASLLAVEIDTPAEREYIRKLASNLGLDAEAVRQVHQAMGIAAD